MAKETLAQQSKWIVFQVKDHAMEGNLKEWLTSLSNRERSHIYFHLLPRSKGFDIEPTEKWINDTINILKDIK